MKKTLLSLVMAVFMGFCVFLTGCGDKGLKNNPPTDATVISNGGMTVRKGDYLYFVNGFVDETTLGKKDNKDGDVTKGALYRTKLDNGDISKDKDGFLNNADCVVSKVVGFGNGGFYIIDDYIVYATPYMGISKDGTLQSNRVEFHRVDIDGTDDEVIFTTSQSEDNLDWTVTKVGSKVYLLVHEGEKIISINATDDKVVATIDGVTSYAFFDNDEYIYNASRTNYNQTHVFYTREFVVEDNKYNYQGNVLCSFDITNGEKYNHILHETNKYTIKHVNKDTIYYTYEKDGVSCLYKRTLVNNFNESTEVQLTTIGYSAYTFINYGVDMVLAKDDNGVWLLENGINNTPSHVLTAARDVLAVFGDYGYYLSEGSLIRFNVRTGELQDAYKSGKTTLITNSNYLDFDGRFVYLFAEYTAENGDKNHYLNYFESAYEGTDIEQRFVGVFENGDVPAKPAQPEEPEHEGDEIEYVPHID